jgi:lipopolysaccharide transport system ATP-binding protein
MGTISVTNLGKAYKQYPNRWSRLLEWLTPGNAKRHQLKWVLQDINFTVNAGEAVGIIGINGAGKSTLLKLITGTTQPTTGSVHMIGRVAAMLELGMGFHPEFSGRQNAIMAGQLLGYTPGDIERLMPEIEAFAEIGEYIAHPVRVYSSGMQVRLAFAVATAIRPDILIVDEALSVGDTYFQHKSIERIKQFRSMGTTLLLVSHDRNAIQGVCDRAILLDDGHIAMEGSPEAVMDFYSALLSKNKSQTVTQIELYPGRVQTRSGTSEVRIESCGLHDAEGELTELVAVGAEVSLRVRVQVFAAVSRLVMGILVKDRLGQPVFGTNTWHTGQILEALTAGEWLEYRISFPVNLGPGSYSIALSLSSSDTHLVNNFDWLDLAVVFSVVNVNKSVFVGAAWLPSDFKILRGETINPSIT